MRAATMSLSLRFVYLLPLVGISPACPGATASEEPAARTTAAEVDADISHQSQPSEAEGDSKRAPSPPERQAVSGLDVGMQLQPFEVVAIADAEAEASCQVCALRDEGTRVLLTHGSLQDPRYIELLLDLQALSRRYREPGLHLLPLVSDPVEIAKASAETLAKRRRLDLDLYRVADGDRTWADYYRLSAPYTVMFADGAGEVRFSDVAPKPLDELDAAIQASGLEVELLEAAAK